MRILFIALAVAVAAILFLRVVGSPPQDGPSANPTLVLERIDAAPADGVLAGSVFRLVGDPGPLADRDVRIAGTFRTRSVLAEDLRTRMTERGEAQEVRARHFLQEGLEARVTIREGAHEGAPGRHLEVSLDGRVEVSSSVLLRPDPAEGFTDGWVPVDRADLVPGVAVEIGRFRGLPVTIEIIGPNPEASEENAREER